MMRALAVALILSLGLAACAAGNCERGRGRIVCVQ